MIKKHKRSVYFLMCCCVVLVWCTSGESNENDILDIVPIWSQACFDDRCYSIEIADTVEDRQRGLMWREELARDAWMLFVFPSSAPWRTFWMKNTYISLDMIRLDSSYTIVYQETNVPPCTTPSCPSYGPTNEISQYVLELNAWEIEALGSEVGDTISIHIEE